ncbi:MAG: carbohydrate-binding protein [Methanospirillum sp.]
MNVRKKILIILFLGCALLAHSAIAATIVAASDASASSKSTAQYICDGSNDEVELNAALARGGEIVMTEGTFRTSGTLNVKSNSIFRGQGASKTVLNMAGDYGARVDIPNPTVSVSDFKITNRGWLMITTSHVKVHDVTIQDSKKTAPTVNGMFFVWADGRVCEDIEFVGCKAIDVGSTGFNLNGQRSPRENRNIRFENCQAIRCGNEGSGKIWAVGFDFHEGADLYDLSVNNCYAEDCWESGFYFEPNFYNGEDPNQAIPVQVNSRVTNCVAVNNGWRNNLDTRFYMTGFYLSCGVTVSDCASRNNRNNGFWVWQSAKDVTLNRCTDDGSDKAFQVRTGSNLKFNDCTSSNARTYALYAWGTSGAVFDDFTIINPKKSSGAVCLGLREDHPNDPWPVTGCTFDILLTGADKNTLIRYYNANNNQITINGIGPVTTTPTITPTPTITSTITVQPSIGTRAIPGTIEAEDYDAGGEGVGYHDVEAENFGHAYRQDGVDIEYSDAADSYVIGWMRPSEWLQYTVNVAKAGTYDATFMVASPNSDTSFKLSVDGTDVATVSVPNTGSWDTYNEVKKPVTLTAGKHVLRITTTGFHNICCMKFSSTGTVTTTTTPTGTGAAIPGLIEAENYNTGGEGTAYHDTTTANEGGTYRQDGVDIEMASGEGSYVVGWVRPGEWLKYTVNIAEAGVYDVSFRVSSPQSDGSFKMQIDNTDVCTVMVPNTGSYLTYTTVVRQVSLPAGSHVMRLYFNGYTNVNWVRFQTSDVRTPPTSPTPTVTATPTAPGILPPPPVPYGYGTGIVPGVIQAEDFNTGGQSVSYYDTTSSNFGGVYRTGEDVDIELSDGASSPVVCWIRPGEWLKYTVNARATGDYDAVFRVSSPQANTQIRLQVDGVTATTFTVPNTGSYDTYTNVTQKVRLTGGPHVLRLVFGGYHNIDYMAFGAVGTLTSSRAAITADANTTAPSPAIMPVTTATATVTVATVNATATNVTTATTVAGTPTVTTANVTATSLTMTALPTTTATVVMTDSVTPAVSVPAVPTDTTTVLKTTSATNTANVTPITTTPTTPITEGNESTAGALAPATSATGTATVTTTATATVVATATPSATPTVEMLMQVAAADRNLSTFVSAVQTAGLTDTLNGLGPYTIFAPTDAAFEALPPGTLEALLSDRDLLASMLTHHVVESRLSAANMTRMPTIKMLDGEPVNVTVQADGRLKIDDALVNRTDIQAGNGVIHVIDAVILPPAITPTQTSIAPSPTATVADTTSAAKRPSVPSPVVPADTTAARTANGTPVTT